MTKPESTPKSPAKKAVRPPAQSQIDEERGDWEGMGQSRYQPEEDAAAGKPSPGANSIANEKGKGDPTKQT